MMQAKYLENLDSLLQWGEYIFFLNPNCNCFTAGRLRLTVNSMEFSAICPPLFFQYLEVPFRVSRKTILPDFDEMFDLLCRFKTRSLSSASMHEKEPIVEPEVLMTTDIESSDSWDRTERERDMRQGIDLATTLERIEKNFVISDPRIPDNPIVRIFILFWNMLLIFQSHSQSPPLSVDIALPPECTKPRISRYTKPHVPT